MTLHELSTGITVATLLMVGWAICHTVRENWTRIKEAFRGRR